MTTTAAMAGSLLLLLWLSASQVHLQEYPRGPPADRRRRSEGPCDVIEVSDSRRPPNTSNAVAAHHPLERHDVQLATSSTPSSSTRQAHGHGPDSRAKLPEFTVVTALFDLGRETWPAFKRPIEVYLNYSRQLLAMHMPIVAYVDPSVADWVWQQRRGKHHMTHLVVTELHDLSFYKRYYSNVADIMASEEYKEDNLVLDHPEGFSPDYNILMNAKFAMLHDVASSNVFDSSYIYWMDIGYAHGEDVYPADHQWTPHNIMGPPHGDQITYIRVNDINLVQSIYQLYKQPVGPAVNGGFFGGSLQAVDSYYHLFLEVWEMCLGQGIVDDDQTIAVACWMHNKGFFNMVPGGWNDAFTMFR